ncbi:hypothetical protein C8J57DRAFT_1612399 [Mycena rebaudengoi]|nr:hypothetical protein C8J57DRAFT_1612399 [Mycena rebaudengoi]
MMAWESNKDNFSLCFHTTSELHQPDLQDPHSSRSIFTAIPGMMSPPLSRWAVHLGFQPFDSGSPLSTLFELWLKLPVRRVSTEPRPCPSGRVFASACYGLTSTPTSPDESVVQRTRRIPCPSTYPRLKTYMSVCGVNRFEVQTLHRRYVSRLAPSCAQSYTTSARTSTPRRPFSLRAYTDQTECDDHVSATASAYRMAPAATFVRAAAKTDATHCAVLASSILVGAPARGMLALRAACCGLRPDMCPETLHPGCTCARGASHCTLGPPTLSPRALRLRSLTREPAGIRHCALRAASARTFDTDGDLRGCSRWSSTRLGSLALTPSVASQPADQLARVHASHPVETPRAALCARCRLTPTLRPPDSSLPAFRDRARALLVTTPMHAVPYLITFSAVRRASFATATALPPITTPPAPAPFRLHVFPRGGQTTAVDGWAGQRDDATACWMGGMGTAATPP